MYCLQGGITRLAVYINSQAQFECLSKSEEIIRNVSPRLTLFVRTCLSCIVKSQVAEVRSRFEGEEGGVERFLEVTKRLGFDRRQVDRSNKMFLLAEFKKSARRPEQNVDFEAKVPYCIIIVRFRPWISRC